jgi:hypothetical protein
MCGSGGRLHAHLTLGKVADPTQVVGAWAASVGRLEVEVGELVLLSRRGDGPMEPRGFVALGTGLCRAPEPRAADVAEHASVRAAERVVSRLRAALPEGEVHVTGSRRIGCALPDADLDLVVALPGPVGGRSGDGELGRGRRGPDVAVTAPPLQPPTNGGDGQAKMASRFRSIQ